jgi:hypothetical protein
MGKDHVGTRLEAEEKARVEALVGAMTRPGFELDMSKTVRLCILRALPLFEKEHGVVPPGTMTKRGGGK